MEVCPLGIRIYDIHFSRQSAQRIPKDSFHPYTLAILNEREEKTDYREGKTDYREGKTDFPEHDAKDYHGTGSEVKVQR